MKILHIAKIILIYYMLIIALIVYFNTTKFLPQMTVEYFGTNTKDPKYTFHLLSAEPQRLQIQL